MDTNQDLRYGAAVGLKNKGQILNLWIGTNTIRTQCKDALSSFCWHHLN